MKRLNFLLFCISAISLFLFYLFITSINPYSINRQFFMFFYFVVFTLVFSFSLFARSYVIPEIFKKVIYQNEWVGLIRQSLIISVVSVILLFLLSITNIGVIDVLLILISALIFEIFFHVRMPLRK